MIADDCQVTKWNGDESAGKAAGVVLESYIVRVNDTPVTLKKDIISLIKASGYRCESASARRSFVHLDAMTGC